MWDKNLTGKSPRTSAVDPLDQDKNLNTRLKFIRVSGIETNIATFNPPDYFFCRCIYTSSARITAEYRRWNNVAMRRIQIYSLYFCDRDTDRWNEILAR